MPCARSLGQELRDRTADQPARDAKILSVTRDAQETAREHDPACAGGSPCALVLGDEAEVAAHVLTEHRAGVRRSVDVHEFRSRREQHAPIRTAEAVTPVRLL